MNARPLFKIDLSERFPHLARAPIVEAVIHWRARSEEKLKRDELRQQLVSALADYPTVKTQHELHLESALGPDGAAVSRRDEWHGFRLESADGRNIAQFTRNGFVFSRVTPYEDWDRFAAEAKRLWQIYVELAKPSEIERLGVRFINRIVPADLNKLDDINKIKRGVYLDVRMEWLIVNWVEAQQGVLAQSKYRGDQPTYLKDIAQRSPYHVTTDDVRTARTLERMVDVMGPCQPIDLISVFSVKHYLDAVRARRDAAMAKQTGPTEPEASVDTTKPQGDDDMVV